MSEIKFTIDNKEYSAKKGQTIVEAAKENGVFIPTLCHFDGLKPAGTCRVCTVKVNGRNMASCTTPVENNMIIDNNIEEINNLRKAIVEMLFVEGNHMCPTCEKSGNCELQALAYRFQMFVPRFPYLWPVRDIVANYPKILIDSNRCIQCLRCVRGVKTSDGKRIFGLVHRGDKAIIEVDPALAKEMTDEQATQAMEICPVGAILKKEVGFIVPIGERKFDSMPIGSEVEGK